MDIHTVFGPDREKEEPEKKMGNRVKVLLKGLFFVLSGMLLLIWFIAFYPDLREKVINADLKIGGDIILVVTAIICSIWGYLIINHGMKIINSGKTDADKQPLR